MSEQTDARLLRLHPADNVLTVISTLEPGAQIQIGGIQAMVTVRLPIGHKVAARAIAAGEHVHTHNLQSDYLPTFLREDQDRYFVKSHQQQHQQQQQ